LSVLATNSQQKLFTSVESAEKSGRALHNLGLPQRLDGPRNALRG
jgi:hypothetical protein